MSLKQVSDLFCRDRQVLAIARLEESKIVVQRAEAFHFLVNGSVEICQVYLWDLILSLQLKVILQPDYVFKKLGKLKACGV